MPESPYRGWVDLEFPEAWKKLLGKCGVFEGIGGPKQKPFINYGLPEYQTMLVALWSFAKLPFFTQLCLVDEYYRRKQNEAKR